MTGRYAVTLALCLFIVVGVSWAVTGVFRRYALSRAMVDVPNHRSSHTVPTARGGGVAIVAATLLGVSFIPGAAIPWPVGLAGLGIAVVGLVDDRAHVPALWRLAAHTIAAGVATWGIGGGPPVDLGIAILAPWPIGNPLTVVLIVWWINLTNFMDGVDGIAAGQTVVVSAGAAAVAWASALPSPASTPSLVLASAAAGFLLWNWPPARIFMGDAGSGFVGFMVAVLGLWAGHASPVLLWVWIILSAAFVADASTTLLIRLRRRERIWEAHRSHAYQRLASACGHRFVTLLVALVNLVWLLPLALAAGAGAVPPAALVLVSYVPLCAGVLWVSHRAASGNA